MRGAQADAKILGDSELGENLTALRNQGDASPGAAIGRQRTDISIAERDGARRMLEQTHDVLHQRRFPDAVAAHDAGNLALGHVHGYAAKGLDHAVGE